MNGLSSLEKVRGKPPRQPITSHVCGQKSVVSGIFENVKAYLYAHHGGDSEIGPPLYHFLLLESRAVSQNFAQVAPEGKPDMRVSVGCGKVCDPIPYKMCADGKRGGIDSTRREGAKGLSWRRVKKSKTYNCVNVFCLFLIHD